MSITKKKILAVGILILVIIVIAVFTAYNVPDQKKVSSKVYVKLNTTDISTEFAKYNEVPVNVTPRVAKYTINPDLSNISNISDFKVSGDAITMLAKYNFFVEPSYSQEFYQVYENNSYNFCPSFVTVDSMLHNYHLMFDYLLKNIEKEHLSAKLKILNRNMLAISLAQYEDLAGTDWENAAKRNVAYFAVAYKLIDSSATVPAIVQDEVIKELSFIDQHENIEVSPVMNIGIDLDSHTNIKEDYTQYIPRGHYTETDQLKSYFKSMMWCGRMTFLFDNEENIKSSLLITLALNDKATQADYADICDITAFFVGKSDDISYSDIIKLITETYGGTYNLKDLVINTKKFATFVEKTKQLEPAKINSIPIFNSEIQPNKEAATKGFRLMGQKFTIDAQIFSQLIDRTVPERMLPSALDIPAAMGSDESLSILADTSQTKYKNYSRNMAKLKEYTSGLTQATWTQNLYWNWLYQLQPLIQKKSDGYPSFMQNTAWTRKELSTYLSSYAELKHDTILYTKQVYAEMGDGGGPIEKDDRGYVEPNPYVYARLAALIEMTINGLEFRGAISSTMKSNLNNMKELSLSLKVISEKELSNQGLTSDEYDLIGSYGGQLEHFWLEINKEGIEMSDSHTYLVDNPAALIADIATDPNGTVLEIGTGMVSNIYAVVPVEGKPRLVVGAVYSYYEFPWPISDRLTDKIWRRMVKDPKYQDEVSRILPTPPEWTNIFTMPNTTGNAINFMAEYDDDF